MGLIIFQTIWPVLVIAIIFIGLGFLEDWWRRKKDQQWLKKWLFKEHTLEEWKQVDPQQFEKITALIFHLLGYRTRVTGGSGDQGIDVVGWRHGQKIYIQCKRVDKVQPKQVRAFYGAIADKLKEGDKGIFVTSGSYTKEDKEFAQAKGIQLINGVLLKELAEKQYE